jgi:predicted nucleic acid-binding protein
MIAAETSSLSAYFQGLEGADTALIDAALAAGDLRLPPVVVMELLSDPSPSRKTELHDVIASIETLAVLDDYWQRAGATRRMILSHKRKCKIADALVAQSCIDHDIPLITRDNDFRHFQKLCGLKLA